VVAVSRPPERGGSPLAVVTVIVGVVVDLTFLFGFGNVLALALRLGVPPWVAPLVASAVDLSVVGLLLAIRHLSMSGASAEVLRSARRLLVASSLVTLALNVAEPLIAGDVGRALFDAVGPLLLIGWAEVGPGLLQALAEGRRPVEQRSVLPTAEVREPAAKVAPTTGGLDPSLVERAKQVDAQHRERHQRPISAEELRKALGVGAKRSRILTRVVREEWA
jgi:hypothetical protein